LGRSVVGHDPPFGVRAFALLVLFAVAVLLSAMPPQLVYAHYFGSNTPAYSTPPHICDTTTMSQCVMNSGVVPVWICCFTGDPMYQPTIDGVNKIDGQVTDVVMFTSTNSDTSKVLTFEGNFGDTSWWAYGACWGNS
jgi:hypothetical protein